MAIEFDGRKIRDQILGDLKKQVTGLSVKPVLAVIWSGDNSVSEKYINSKKKVAAGLGIDFLLFELKTEKKIIEKITILNFDKNISGIMVQMPLFDGVDRRKVIKAITPEKDVDGLRYCAGLDSKYFPPVALAVLEAIKNADVSLAESRVAIIGQGFLVGAPLSRILKEQASDLRLVGDKTKNLSEIIFDADIVISATGHAGLIKANMVKSGVVLIDAGTTELGGKLVGDIDPNCYSKSSFYTPVLGGIGPLTVAILFKNLFTAAQKQNPKS